MRRTILSWLAFFNAILIFAQNVTPDEAEQVAKQFLYGIETKSAEQVVKRVAARGVAVDSSVNPVYIFNKNDEHGFVIVSGSKQCQPVLAYSNRNAFTLENIPPNLEEWLSQMMSCISEFQRSGDTDAPEHPKWAAFRSSYSVSSSTPVIQYETAEWSQDSPYNDLCPTINGEKCLTGCTATALAILMRYYKHPLYGHGYTDSYEYVNEKGGRVTIDSESLNERFNWDQMPLKNPTSWTQENKKSVSRLIYLCALMCQVEFGIDVSIGYIDIGHKSLHENLDYDKSSLFHLRVWYTEEQWQEIICKNLKDIGPLLYSARSGEDGHSFVIDGYDSDSMYHINWGWGGNSNGYFAFPGFLSFKYNHRAALGVRPNQNGDPVQFLTLTDSYGLTGITLYEVESVQENTPFTISCGFLKNQSVSTSYNGYVRAVTLDKQGNVKEIISEDSRVELDAMYGYKSYKLRCLVTKDIEVGDRITLYQKNDRDGVWRRVLFDRYSICGELPIYDQLYIEESTTITFNPEDRRLSITLKPGVNYQLLFDGSLYLNGVSGEDEPIIIDTSLLPGGTYTFRMEKKKELVNLLLEIKGDQ